MWIQKRIEDLLFKTYILLFRKWHYLHFKRTCSNTSKPVARYLEGSWVDKESTQDQERITEFLKNLPVQNKSVLHIGIGNSTLAKQLSSHVAHLDGVSIMQDEVDYAHSLQLLNYSCFNINKYSSDMLSLPRQYNYIVDNNLSSYACCITHFEQQLKQYLQLLKPHGQIITDKEGLYYYFSGFGLLPHELKKWEAIIPMQVTEVNTNILLIEKKV